MTKITITVEAVDDTSAIYWADCAVDEALNLTGEGDCNRESSCTHGANSYTVKVERGEG